MGSNENPFERANDAIERKEYAEAARLYESALPDIEDPRQRVNVLNRISDLWFLTGDRSAENLDRVTGYLEQSLALDESASSVEARSKLCQTYLVSMNFPALVTHASRLLDDPEYGVRARLWLASAHFVLDEKSPGLAQLRQLVDDLDRMKDAELFSLLDLLTSYDCPDEAQTVIDHVRGTSGESLWLQECQAQLYCETREFESALSILNEELISSCGDPEIARRLYSYRAKSLDATGEYQAAHDSFTAMNRLARESIPNIRGRDFVAAYSALDLDGLAKRTGGQALPYVPVFMVGFPRSGTTLLDTILDTQDRIGTLSEVDGIGEAWKTMRNLGKNYPEDLAALSDAEITQLREAYFERNRAFLPGDESFTVLIDKLPLNILHIPLIITLFPDAKFILSLRHPLDVCLSCYQQNFLLNDQMLYFTDLEECFTRYAAVMGLFERYRTHLDLNIHTVRYEQLVDDLDGVAQSVFDFLDFQANEKYREFFSINKDKLIVTPSRGQVDRPMYKSSRNRWTNYSDQLKPFVPLVKTFIERFGYTV